MNRCPDLTIDSIAFRTKVVLCLILGQGRGHRVLANLFRWKKTCLRFERLCELKISAKSGSKVA